MQKKIVFISGWGTDESLWLSTKKEWKKFLGDGYSYGYLPWCSFVRGDFAECFKKNISLLEADELMLVGWSLGGMIALALSDFLSKNVSKMILFSTSSRMLSDGDYEGVGLVSVRAMMKKLHSHREVVMKDFFSRCCQQKKNHLVDFFLKQSSHFDQQKLLDGLDYLRCFDQRKKLPDKTKSTLIFHGYFDKIIPITQAQYLVNKMPHASAKYMKAGHDLLFSHSVEVGQIVQDFLFEQVK